MSAQLCVNLTFHGLGESLRADLGDELQYWVEPAAFEEIIRGIRNQPHVAVSFDDGNASDTEVALPALLDAGMTATFFVTAGKLGQPGYLARSDLRTLAEAGMRIGTHGMHHRPWPGLGEREHREELFEARAVLQDLSGQRVDWAACPFGAYDRRTLARLRRAGYARVFTSDGGVASRDAWLQPRRSIRRDDTPQAVLASLRHKPNALAESVRRIKRTLKGLR